MNEKTMTTKELAEFFGKSVPTITRTANKVGISFENGVTKMYTKGEVELISRALYKTVPFFLQKAIDDSFGKNKTFANEKDKTFANEKHRNEVSEHITKADLVDFAKIIVKETMSSFLPLLNSSTKQIEFKQDYFSIKGYSSKQGQQLNFSEAVTLGKIASKLSRERGIEIRTVEDERFGFVNSYHIDILEEVFRM